MIQEETVFVVGAGASVPFDYPSGESLVKWICSDAQCTDALQRCSFSPEMIQQFQRALRHSGRLSIDAFLEHNALYHQIGKCAIAAALIRQESADRLFRLPGDDIPTSRSDGNWIRYLFNLAVRQFKDFHANKWSFITFNYDRVIEEYFYTALINAFNAKPADAATAVQQLRLIHLYGCLTDHECLNTGGRAYRDECARHDIEAAASGIKIMAEGQKHTDGFTLATKWLTQANRVYFLGFGFAPDNVERLQPKAWLRAQAAVTGTAYGLRDAQRRMVEQMFQSRIVLAHDTVDCAEFMRRNFEL